MSSLTVHLYRYMSDNYGVLLHNPTTGDTACIDTGDAQATLSELQSKGWSLSEIWVTHHHADHTAGVSDVKAATGASVIGPKAVSQAIESIDKTVGDGDSFMFSGTEVRVLHTPGHTLDMLNFYLPEEQIVFTGDTLFTMGCGRLFEGTAEQMHESLSKLTSLPPQTSVYGSHEYTLANAQFALSVDADNEALQQKYQQVQQLVSAGEPTVPSTIAEELATNPFLRANNAAIRKNLNMQNDSDASVFAEIRRRKDNF